MLNKLYLIAFVCCYLPAAAQYDPVSTLLSKADKLMEQADYDSAMATSLELLRYCQSKKLLHAEAQAHLQLADIYYRKGVFIPMGRHDTAALKIGQQLKDNFLIAWAYYRRAQYLMSLDRFKESHDYLQKALQTKFEKDQSWHTGVIYNDIGYVYGMEGELHKQVEWYVKALQVYEREQYNWGLAQTLGNLGTTYNELKQQKEAIQYTRKALAIREKLHDIGGLSISYNNLAQMYVGVDSLEQAMEALESSSKYAAITGNKARIAHNYATMSLILQRQKKLPEALEYEKKAIALAKEAGDNNLLSRRYIAAAIYSKQLNDSTGALRYFQQAEDLAKVIHNKYNMRDVFYFRAIFYKDRKDFYNAYESYKKYILYRDSLVTDETNAKIADVQARYETEKKDREILELSTAQRIKQLEIEKQKAIIAGNMLEAAQKEKDIQMLSQTRELQDAMIKQRDEELEKQMLIARNKEQELLLARQEKALHEKQLQTQKQFRNGMIIGLVLLVITGVLFFNRFQLKKKLEQQQALLDMRNHIARDLHDEIGSTLTSINILSQVSQTNLEKDKAKTSGLLQKITEQSQQIQQSMSDIVWTIKSDNDKVANMIVRMREFLSHTLEPRNIEVDFEADESLLDHNFTMSQRKDLFLIFKEAVNNAAKYAHCSSLQVRLMRVNGHIELLVSDNGRGFDVNKTGSSNGLKNMQGRARSLNAQLAIASEPGKGTRVVLELPAT